MKKIPIFIVVLVTIVAPLSAFRIETLTGERRERGVNQISPLATEFSQVAANECEPTNDGKLACSGRLEEITAQVDAILSRDDIRCWRTAKWEIKIEKYLEDGTPVMVIRTPTILACDFP